MPEEPKKLLSVDSPEARLRLVRERSGKSPEEVASLAGMNGPSYYDLENCEDELTMTISLRELKRLCDVLQIPASNLFSDRPQTKAERISPKELAARIKQYIQFHALNISEFENKIGFEIEECIRRSDSVLDWNVDCLRAVCGELGLDWYTALP
jgi:transcriptional regulator with XRE-family HTH domain